LRLDSQRLRLDEQRVQLDEQTPLVEEQRVRLDELWKAGVDVTAARFPNRSGAASGLLPLFVIESCPSEQQRDGEAQRRSS
jgi:hypothetical protein